MKLFKNDRVFRDQCQTLLDGDTIDINIEPAMAHTSFVILFFPLDVLAHGAQDPGHVGGATVDNDVSCRLCGERCKLHVSYFYQILITAGSDPDFQTNRSYP